MSTPKNQGKKTKNTFTNVIKYGIPLFTAALSFFTLIYFNNNYSAKKFTYHSQKISINIKNKFEKYENILNNLNAFLIQNPLSSQKQVDEFLNNYLLSNNLSNLNNILYLKRVSIDDFSQFYNDVLNKENASFDNFKYSTQIKDTDLYVIKYAFSQSHPQSTKSLELIGNTSPKIIESKLKKIEPFGAIISVREFNNKDDSNVFLLSLPYYNPTSSQYSGALAISLKISDSFFNEIKIYNKNTHINIIDSHFKNLAFSKNFSGNNEDTSYDHSFTDTIYVAGYPLQIQILSSYQMNYSDKILSFLISLACMIITFLLIKWGILKEKEQNKESKYIIENYNALSDEFNKDSLTGLFNRRFFFTDMGVKVTNPNSSNNIFILFIDLDGFKNINDSIGHAAGDEVLRQYSNRLKNNTLNKDSSIYRMGGDEFVILFENNMEKNIQLNVKDVMTIAHEILKITDEPFNIKNEARKISQSVGIARYVNETPEELLTNADTAMYEAKRLGKDRVVYYSSSLHNQAQQRNEIIKMLKLAIPNNEFYLVFQPKMYKRQDIYVNKGVEILMRWQSEIMGNVSPQVFIPIAEDSGIMPLIDNWLFEEAAMRMIEMQSQGVLTTFSINISAKQFSNVNLPDIFYNILQKYNINPDTIIIEITESATIQEPELAQVILKKFRNYGFGISIDDFGTGYSSISYLRQFPVTEIKFDRSFTKNINIDSHDEIIISGLSSIAKKLNLDIVIEGVETQSQIDWIENNIPSAIIQGYFFSKPLPINEFITFSKRLKIISSQQYLISQNVL